MKYYAAFAFLAVLSAAERDGNQRFYDAIRAGDAAAVRQLLESGAGIHTKDARGGTPLHYAAAFGTPETLRILVAAGADVNARTDFGATPLMWSTTSLEKVRLLLDKGADVNARSKLGNNALSIAAGQAGNLEVVRWLLDHGASVMAAPNERGLTPLMRAAHASDPVLVKLVVEKGDDVHARDAGGRTPLMFAAAQGDAENIKLLLAKGADVNVQSGLVGGSVKNGRIAIGHLTALLLAAATGNSAAVRLLLDAGADVNARDVRGMTPLMAAIATDHANPEIVRLVLARQPDVTIRSETGETALSWAEKFQYSPVLAQVRKASVGLEARRVTATDPGRSGGGDIRKAAQKSLGLMQKTAASFFRQGGCVSCHAQHITGIAAAVARSKGLSVDEAAAADILKATRLEFAARADQFLEREDGPADVILTYALVALAAQEAPPDRMTDAMIRNVASQQRLEGYWNRAAVMRPPTTDGNFTITATSIRALRQYAPPGLKSEMDVRIARATDWLVHAEASTTQDAVMQLLGAKWGGADAATIERLTRRLVALQRKSGGWAQTPDLQPDAYATGTALYALHEGGGISPADDAYRRGVRFLLDTQAADGSWRVASRAPRIQPYFESGFPYGDDQWISQWATGWAAAALALAAPERVAVR